MLKVSLEDIMCEHPITVREDISVGKVAHLLLRYRINGIIVVGKKDKNKVVGVFAMADIMALTSEVLSRGAHRIRELEKIGRSAVGKFSSKEIISLQKDDKVAKAIALMHKKDIHTLLVYDRKKLVGVVGRHDLLNAALSYY